MKLGKFYEQPKLYVVLLMLSLLIYLLYDHQAGIVLSILTSAGGFSYLFKKPKLLMNGVKGNTGKAVLIGVVGLALTVVMTLGFAWLMGAIKSFDMASLSSFLQYNKLAVLGSETLPFAGNAIFTFIVFIIAFPITETSVALQLHDYILESFKQPLNIKAFSNWMSAALIGIGAIFYHIYAKASVTGGINENVLMVMFFIFFTECLIASYTREMESSVYHHIVNNGLAML